MRKLLLCCILLIGCTLLLLGTRRGSRASTPETVYSYLDLEEVPVAQASFIRSINKWISHNDLRGMVERLQNVIAIHPENRWQDIDAVRIYNEYVGNTDAPKGSFRHAETRQYFTLSDLDNVPADLPQLPTPDETRAQDAARRAAVQTEPEVPVEVEADYDVIGTDTTDLDVIGTDPVGTSVNAPVVLIRPDGNAFSAWVNQGQILAMHYNPTTQTWEVSVEISIGGTNSHPVITTDNNNIVVTWFNADDGRYYSARYDFNTATWGAPVMQ